MTAGVLSRDSTIRVLSGPARRVFLRAWWSLLAPGLLAVLALELLLPALATSAASPSMHAFPVLSGATLGALIFVLYAGLARYWRYHLPGCRTLSGLSPGVAAQCRNPDELGRFAYAGAILSTLGRPVTKRGCERALPAAVYADLNRHMEGLGDAVSTHSRTDLERELACVETLAAPVLRAKRWRDSAGTLVAIVLAGALVLGLRRVTFDTYGVENTSMLPTLEPGDVVVGHRLGRDARASSGAGLRRGDIVVFESRAIKTTWPVGTPDLLVKRVIGLPGDQVEVFADNAFINGWRVPACDVGPYTYVPPGGDGAFVQGRIKLEFLEGRTYVSLRPPVAPESAPYTVQSGEVYVLGDNRHNSYDSRAWQGGVPVSAIEAKVAAFGLGTHRDGSTDFTRLLRSVDGAGVRMEGLDARLLGEQLEACRRVRQKGDTPPPPGAASAATQQ